MIKEGDIVVVLDTSRKDKWIGLVNQKQGFFPPWVVVKGPSLSSSHDMPSDCSEDDSSVSDPKMHKGQQSKEQPANKQTLLEVAELPEPDEASLSAASHAEPEVQVSNNSPKQESNEQSLNGNTGSALTQNIGNSGQPDLELISPELATGTTTVSDSPRDTGQSGVTKTSSSDMKCMSPSPASSEGSDESFKSSHELQNSGEDQSNVECSGTGSIGSTETAETAGSTETTGSSETALSSNNDTAASDGSEEPAKKKSKVTYTLHMICSYCWLCLQ